jgi:hypothetical protein
LTIGANIEIAAGDGDSGAPTFPRHPSALLQPHKPLHRNFIAQGVSGAAVAA